MPLGKGQFGAAREVLAADVLRRNLRKGALHLPMKCPKCKTDFKPKNSDIAKELGSRTSTAKKMAARNNGKLGGRPKQQKVKARK